MKELNEENANGYVVFGIGYTTPTVTHESEVEAINEANGLSIKHPNKMFCVCKVAYTVKAKMIPELTMRAYE